MKNRRMIKSLPTLLTTMIGAALYSQGAFADLAEQCMLGVPTYDQPLVTGDPNQLPVNIQADQLQGNYPDSALYSGDVHVKQGNSTLTADQVQLNQISKPGDAQPTRTVTATGDVHYGDNQILLKGPRRFLT